MLWTLMAMIKPTTVILTVTTNNLCPPRYWTELCMQCLLQFSQEVHGMLFPPGLQRFSTGSLSYEDLAPSNWTPSSMLAVARMIRYLMNLLKDWISGSGTHSGLLKVWKLKQRTAGQSGSRLENKLAQENILPKREQMLLGHR
jgi:hypothetical protein